MNTTNTATLRAAYAALRNAINAGLAVDRYGVAMTVHGAPANVVDAFEALLGVTSGTLAALRAQGIVDARRMEDTFRATVAARAKAQRAAADRNDPALHRRVLETLYEAETFESFIHAKFVGQKRFSLEGGESLMVALDTILQNCPASGVLEIVMGMAHRGRLNVLSNFVKKPASVIFGEFQDFFNPEKFGGGEIFTGAPGGFARMTGFTLTGLRVDGDV